MQFVLHHNSSDGACTTAMSQSMENENSTCEMLGLGCRTPKGFASEKIGPILRPGHSAQAVLINKAGMEYVYFTVSMHDKELPSPKPQPPGMRPQSPFYCTRSKASDSKKGSRLQNRRLTRI